MVFGILASQKLVRRLLLCWSCYHLYYFFCAKHTEPLQVQLIKQLQQLMFREARKYTTEPKKCFFTVCGSLH